MSKKRLKKKDEEELEEEEESQTKLQWLIRCYKEIPAFKSLVKLTAYFIFFAVVIILINVLVTGDKKSTNKKTSTTAVEQIKYQDLLEELLSNKQYKCEIEINGKGYILNGLYGNNILTGSLFTNEGTYSYKLQDNIVYEVKLNNKVQNDNLLQGINKNIIENNSLVSILKRSSGIKVEAGYKYNKIKIDDEYYNIDIKLKDNHIKYIDITNDNSSYKFTYDEAFLID